MLFDCAVDILPDASLLKVFWPHLLMDCGLVADVSRLLQYGAVGAILVWLAVDGTESASDFGLYDAAFPFGFPRPAPEICDCATPPCRVSAVNGVLVCVYSGESQRKPAERYWDSERY